MELPLKRSRIREALATLGGAIFLFIGLNFFFVILGAISLEKVLAGASLEPFRLGNVPIPKFQGAGTTYLDMLIFCVVAVVAVTIGIGIRYFYYRDKIEFLRSKGITDHNKDGKMDNFADEFMDDL